MARHVVLTEAEIDRYATRLTADHFAVLMLLTATNYAGIAALLKIPVGTVKSRINRARSRLLELQAMDAAPGHCQMVRNAAPCGRVATTVVRLYNRRRDEVRACIGCRDSMMLARRGTILRYVDDWSKETQS